MCARRNGAMWAYIEMEIGMVEKRAKNIVKNESKARVVEGDRATKWAIGKSSYSNMVF